MHFVSIKKKLLNNTLLLLVGAFCLILALVIGLNLYQSQQNLQQSQTKLNQHLQEKAQMLILSNQFALKGMVEDNSITNIKDFIEMTVSKDSSIVYGYYMDETTEIWAKSDAKNILALLPDKHTEQISTIKSFATNKHKLGNGLEIIEFAAPVELDLEVVGFIVYGYSTEQLNQDLSQLKKSASSNALISIIIILAIVFGTLVVTYSITKKQAETITQPLASLAKSAKTIAIGNYDLSIKAETNDEIGELSRDFESMRKTVKLYTKRLKDMVQEKIAQVNDILANIEEGIFTISLTGVIQGQHSKSILEILKVDNLEGVPLTSLLDLSDDQIDFFNDWLRLASTKYNKMRWVKIVQLCPLLEVNRTLNNQTQSLKLNFQKVYNKHDELEKLMVQVVDVTESKALEQKVQAERIEHEHQLRLVLGIAENPPETIDLFIEDSLNRILEIQETIRGIKSKEMEWSGSIMNIWLENIHTIKGNAGSLGFEKLNQIAHETENTLLSPDIISGINPITEDFTKNLRQLQELVDEIDQKDKLLHGDSTDKILRIPEKKFSTLIKQINLAESIDPQLQNLVKVLPWKPAEELTQKYRRIIEKANLPTQKQIQFQLHSANSDLPPDFFHKIDAPIIHILRNSISHGFRKQSNAEYPIIVFTIAVNEEVQIKISDNGLGIDPEQIYNRALELNLVSESDLLTTEEKVALIFEAKFSSSEKASLLSGRGVGMSMVKRTLEELDGRVDLHSEKGKGTTFILNIPRRQFQL